VGEEDDAQRQPKHGERNVGTGGEQFSEHKFNIHHCGYTSLYIPDGMMKRAV
jgi:hypothetical protein